MGTIPPGDYLPLDTKSANFDNIADVQLMSPTLMDAYMRAATTISRLAVGDTSLAPVSETYNVSERLMQDDRVSEDTPFGSRGGVAIRHYFPLNAQYDIRIRLQRDRVLDIQPTCLECFF